MKLTATYEMTNPLNGEVTGYYAARKIDNITTDEILNKFNEQMNHNNRMGCIMVLSSNIFVTDYKGRIVDEIKVLKKDS